jgi:hypothetical protein
MLLTFCSSRFYIIAVVSSQTSEKISLFISKNSLIINSFFLSFLRIKYFCFIVCLPKFSVAVQMSYFNDHTRRSRMLLSSDRISLSMSDEESASFSGCLDLRCCFAPWIVYFLLCKRCLIFKISSTSFLLYSLCPEDVLFGFIFVNPASQNRNTYVGSSAISPTSPILKYSLSGNSF